MNRVCLSLLAASWTRASAGGRSFRLCVRSSVRSLSPSSGLPLPSTRLVSFGGFIRYYEQVRLPTSARLATSVFPRDASPSATVPTDPVGPPGSRRRPFVRDVIHDPGGASPPGMMAAYTWPSTAGTVSASTTFSLSGLPFHTPHDSCLRFGPRVAATPARLGSDWSAPTLVGRDLHPRAVRQCSGALPVAVEI